MVFPVIAFRSSPSTAGELDKLAKKAGEKRADVAREMFELGMQVWREKQALDEFYEGKTSFSLAAERANLTVWEFFDLLGKQKRPFISISQDELDAGWKRAEQLARA